MAFNFCGIRVENFGERRFGIIKDCHFGVGLKCRHHAIKDAFHQVAQHSNAYGSLLVSSHPSSRARATMMASSNASASPTGVHLPAFILRGQGLFSG
ncbi:hypothetical protein [Mycobacterium sp. URHB0021]